MQLILIRHRESQAGLRRIIGGPTGCTGLTERGVTQARALADRFSRTGEVSDCAVLLASPWQRAHETAEILAGALPTSSIQVDGNLCETRPGEADGLSWEEYQRSFGAFDMLAVPDRPFAPGGESWLQFRDRVETTLRNLAERYEGQTVVAVSHGGFVVASLIVLFDIPRPGTNAWLNPEHTSITEWQVSNAAWNLVRYNDTAHLANLN